jgi:uncharacterized membrane protein
MSKRQTVMGLPIGRRKPSFPLARAARVGAIGATALAAVPAAQMGMRAVHKGQEMTDQAGHALDAAGQIKDAVSSHSSTIGKTAGLIGAVRRLSKKDSDKPKLAHLIEEHTDISAPRQVVYNQWTQMAMFPRITKGITSVEQKNDSETQWSGKIGPIQRQWKGKITEQIPDERIAWKSDGGPEQQGVVTFHSLDDDLTRVLVQMHYKPSGPFEVVGNKLRIQRRRVRRDLRLFKHFLELRGEATGEWRGTIHDESDKDKSADRDQQGDEQSNEQGGEDSGARQGSGQSSDGDRGARSRTPRRAAAAKKAGGASRGSSSSASRSSGTASRGRSNGSASRSAGAAGRGRSATTTSRSRSNGSSARSSSTRKSTGARAKAGSR